MRSRLLVSLSGVHGANLDRCARFADELRVPVSLLVRPAAVPEAAGWLATRVSGGDCAVLHGLGGLSALPGHETALRLVAVNAMLEDVALPMSCFALRSAPRDMRDALRRFGFRVCASASGVHDLIGERAFAGRMVDLGRAEQWRRAAAVLAAGRALRRPEKLVRLAVDAAEVTHGGVPDAVRAAVELAVRNGAQPITMLDLASPLPARRPVSPTPDESLWSQTA